MKIKLIFIIITLLSGMSYFYLFKEETISFVSPYRCHDLKEGKCSIFFIDGTSIFHKEEDKKMIMKHAEVIASNQLKNNDIVVIYYFKDSIWSRGSTSELFTSETVEFVASEEVNFIFTMKSAFFCRITAVRNDKGNTHLTMDETFEHIR